MNKIRVAIVGAAGYTGEELLRLLLGHPLIEITCITSRENAGKSLGDIFPRYAETVLTFSEPDVEKIAESAELVFLCLPHGLASEFAIPLINKELKVFDISADFRLKSAEKYKQYYGANHPAPEFLSQAVYGLPEKNREQIKMASLIACPGCYPTSAILPIYPLLKKKLIQSNSIRVCGMSGVTGAGRKAQMPYLFPECNESIRSYSTTGHRHLAEIEQVFEETAGGDRVEIGFSAHLIPVNRGLYTTTYATIRDPKTEISEIESTLRSCYDHEPFVRLLPNGKLPDTKNVVYTNLCEIGFDIDPRTGSVILTSAIDNLTKGASGQAVQCMNIVCGFDERKGLI